jgi:tetratricopeptide (TPR) repeat protein
VATEMNARPRPDVFSAPLQAQTKKPRDVARIVAWSATVLISSSLLWGGYVWKARPDVAAVLSCAEFQVKLGLYDAAYTSLEDVLDREPEDAYANLLMGYVQERRRAYGPALEHMLKGKACIEASGNPAFVTDWMVSVGFLRVANGEFHEALQVAEEVLSRDPQRASAYVIRAFSRLGVQDDNGYRREIAKAYALDPGDIAFRMERSLVTTAMPWACAFEVSGGADALSLP